jgi:uncharacterized phage protein (TIGR02220 family)
MAKVISADRMVEEINDVVANISRTLELDVGKSVALALLLEKWVESQPKYTDEGSSDDGWQDICKEAIEYLNQKNGTKYRASSKKTQACVRARVRDGFTLEDFKAVIDAKVSQWGDDEKMAEYPRPETLFGTKFEGYLQNATKTRGGVTETWNYSQRTSKWQ